METIKTKIENETQYNWAIARIDELLKVVHDDTPDDDPNSIELYLISGLVEEYEDVHYPIGTDLWRTDIPKAGQMNRLSSQNVVSW